MIVDESSRKIKALSVLVIILLLVVIGLLVYILYDKKINNVPVDNTPNNEREVTPKDDEEDNKENEKLLDTAPEEIINFPKENDEGVVVKKVSELTEEDKKLFEKSGDHIPEVAKDEEEPVIYFYKNHIIKYWKPDVRGFGKLVIDNGMVFDYVVDTVNDINNEDDYKVVPVISKGKMYVVEKSSTCYIDKELDKVNALNLIEVTFDDNYENETELLKTFKSIPEGSSEGPECEE